MTGSAEAGGHGAITVTSREVLAGGDPLVLRCYDYWAELCRRRGGALPSHKDIQPGEIPDLLSRFALIELCPAGSFDPMYRLAGTELERTAGRSLTGTRFRDLFGPEGFAAIAAVLAGAAADRLPRYVESRVEFPDRQFHTMRRLVMPCASDGKTVDILAGLGVTLDAGPP